VRLLFKSFLLLILLVAGTANAWSADGRILSFEGDVRVNGQSVQAETLLNRNDTITTGPGATVKIVLSDNSVLDLESESNIRLSDYSYNPSTPQENKSEVSVVEGTLRYVSGLIAKEDPDNIRFTAGNSTIGVRGSFTAIEVNGVVVNVEAMIGEATLVKEREGGQKDIVVVPTGQTTQTDPATGETLLAPSTVSNAVNAVVQAIAAAAPDASTRRPDDEGCSSSGRPLRRTPRPVYDAATAAAIEAQLAALSKGELMMVMAVLINNAGHLCIDSATVANTIGVISTVRPGESPDVVFIATLLDPQAADQFTKAATEAAPDQSTNIQQAKDTAEDIAKDFSTVLPPRTPTGEPVTETQPPPETSDPPIDTGYPPGGAIGEPPSPE